MTVGISFVLDQGDETADATTSPFDSHSVSISSDALGKLTMHGEGGSSAQGAIDTTAAGDIWDNFDSATTGTTVSSSSGGADVLVYALPTIMDDLAISASYSPQQSNVSSATAYAATYSGVEGLSVSYGKGDKFDSAAGVTSDATTMKASYAYGSFTLAYSNNDFSTSAANLDQETTSYKVSYTVSDAISVSYGTEEIKLENDDQEAEYEMLTVAYTSGGMTVTAKQASSTDALHGTTTGVAVESSASNADILVYALPEMIDGLAVSASYSPQQAVAASSTAYALTYTGVEGLSVSYGKGDENLGSSSLDTDTTTMKASYVYGSFTLAYSNNDHSSAVTDADQETTSYKVSYTVSDAISVSYGTEEIEKENSTTDAEFERLSVSYTSGGMTLSAQTSSSTDALHGTTDLEDRDYWSLGLAFAF
jgi:outer membrane protein OmpU